MEEPGPDRRRFRRASRRFRRRARRTPLNLLLDTHVVLWWMAGEQERVGSEARGAIEMGAPVLISAVVIWEVAIKRHLGKLDAPEDLLDQLERAEVDLLPITPRHAERVAALPMHHRDPFDRLLVAQAQLEELPLLSADANLADYGVEVVW